MNKAILPIVCFFILGPATAQEDMSSLLVKVLKQQLKELKEEPPQEEQDEIIRTAPAFIPPNGKFNMDAELNKHMDSVKKNIQVSTGGASLYETDAGELRIDFLQVNTDWVHIPCWQNMHIVPAFTSVTSSNGKEVILPKTKHEEYMEKGYFSNDQSYGPSYGNNEMKVYLDKEPTSEDYPLRMKGELWISYPAEYQSFTFTKSDTGKPVQMDKYKVMLLSIDKNTVMYKVSGPRGFSDEYSKLCTNKKDKPFVSRHGSSLGYDFYMEAKKNNFALSDRRLEELAKNIEKEAYAGGNLEQLYIEKVSGTFFKITFYKVVKTVEQMVPVELKAGE